MNSILTKVVLVLFLAALIYFGGDYPRVSIVLAAIVGYVGANLSSSSPQPLSSQKVIRTPSSVQRPTPRRTPDHPLSPSAKPSPLSTEPSPLPAEPGELSSQPHPLTHSCEDETESFGDSVAPHFPLIVTDVGSYERQEVYPNWRSPIPFENDYFQGHCVIKLRTDPIDDVFYPYFNGRRRYLEFQMQGKFKVLPKGTLYMGIELDHPPLSLGFMIKQLSNLILGVLRRMISNVHTSYGTPNEYPHGSFPIVSAVDSFTETPPGETPPPLGVASFPPSNDKQAFTHSDPSKRQIFKLDHTYSISFHSMYLNLVDWTITNLPGGMKDVAIATIIGQRGMRFVAYDMDISSKVHRMDEKIDYFCFHFKHLKGRGVTWPDEETRVIRSTRKRAASLLSGHLEKICGPPIVKQEEEQGNTQELKPEISNPEVKVELSPIQSRSSSARVSPSRTFKVSPRPPPHLSLSPKRKGRLSKRKEKAKPINQFPSDFDISQIADVQIPISILFGKTLWFVMEFAVNFNPPKSSLGTELPHLALSGSPPRSASPTPRLPKKPLPPLRSPHLVSPLPRDDVDEDSTSSSLSEVSSYSEVAPSLTDDGNPSGHLFSSIKNGRKESQSTTTQKCTVFRNARDIRLFGSEAKVSGLRKVYSKAIISKRNMDPKRNSIRNCFLELAGIDTLHQNSSSEEEESQRDTIDQRHTPLMKEADRPLSLLMAQFASAGYSDSLFWSVETWRQAGFEFSNSSVHKGMLVRAQRETTWIATWGTLTPTSFKCYDITNKKTPKVTVAINEIVQASPLNESQRGGGGCGDEAPPFRGVFFFRVETTVTVHYYFVQTEIERTKWIYALSPQAKRTSDAAPIKLLSTQSQRPEARSPPLLRDNQFPLEDPLPLPPRSSRREIRSTASITSPNLPILTPPNNSSPQFHLSEQTSSPKENASSLAPPHPVSPSQPSGTSSSITIPLTALESSPELSSETLSITSELPYRKVGKKKVLNGKRLSFFSSATDRDHPLRLSAALLTVVTSLNQTASASALAAFTDMTNALKAADVTSLGDSERVMFFLNVFHTLTLHGLLVLGTPSNETSWNKFFQNVAYECGGHIFSLMEIEQNILRARGARSKLFGSSQPKWSQSDPRRNLAVQKMDLRVIILLNHGSDSLVPKLTPGNVEQQMNDAVALMLDQLVRLDEQTRQISLPKTFSWYQKDFGSEGEMIQWIFQHASANLHQRLLKTEPSGSFGNKSLNVKYRNFNSTFRTEFECLDVEEKHAEKHLFQQQP